MNRQFAITGVSAAPVCFLRLGPCELPLSDQWLVHTQLSQSAQPSQASFYSSPIGGQGLGGLGGLSANTTLPIQQHSSGIQQQAQLPHNQIGAPQSGTTTAATSGAAPASQLQSQSKIMNVVVPSVACPPTASKKIRRKPDAKPQSQINKCNNEKRRRELENEYIEQLGEFLQIKRDMTACKPDKAAILSEVVRTIYGWNETIRDDRWNLLPETKRIRREAPSSSLNTERWGPGIGFRHMLEQGNPNLTGSRCSKCSPDCSASCKLHPVQQGEVSSTEPPLPEPSVNGHSPEKSAYFEAVQHYISNVGWALLEINSEGVIECATENVRDVLHYSRTELHGQSIYSYLHTGDHSKLSPILNKNSFELNWDQNEMFYQTPKRTIRTKIRWLLRAPESANETIEQKQQRLEKYKDLLIISAPVKDDTEESSSVLCLITLPEDDQASIETTTMPQTLDEQLTLKLDINGNIINYDASTLRKQFAGNLTKETIGSIYDICHYQDHPRLTEHLGRVRSANGTPLELTYRLRLGCPDVVLNGGGNAAGQSGAPGHAPGMLGGGSGGVGMAGPNMVGHGMGGSISGAPGLSGNGGSMSGGGMGGSASTLGSIVSPRSNLNSSSLLCGPSSDSSSFFTAEFELEFPHSTFDMEQVGVSWDSRPDSRASVTPVSTPRPPSVSAYSPAAAPMCASPMTPYYSGNTMSGMPSPSNNIGSNGGALLNDKSDDDDSDIRNRQGSSELLKQLQKVKDEPKEHNPPPLNNEELMQILRVQSNDRKRPSTEPDEGSAIKRTDNRPSKLREKNKMLASLLANPAKAPVLMQTPIGFNRIIPDIPNSGMARQLANLASEWDPELNEILNHVIEIAPEGDFAESELNSILGLSPIESSTSSVAPSQSSQPDIHEKLAINAIQKSLMQYENVSSPLQQPQPQPQFSGSPPAYPIHAAMAGGGGGGASGGGNASAGGNSMSSSGSSAAGVASVVGGSGSGGATVSAGNMQQSSPAGSNQNFTPPPMYTQRMRIPPGQLGSGNSGIPANVLAMQKFQARERILQEQQRARLLQQQQKQQMVVNPSANSDLGPPNVTLTRANNVPDSQLSPGFSPSLMQQQLSPSQRTQLSPQQTGFQGNPFNNNPGHRLSPQLPQMVSGFGNASGNVNQQLSPRQPPFGGGGMGAGVGGQAGNQPPNVVVPGQSPQHQQQQAQHQQWQQNANARLSIQQQNPMLNAQLSVGSGGGFNPAANRQFVGPPQRQRNTLNTPGTPRQQNTFGGTMVDGGGFPGPPSPSPVGVSAPNFANTVFTNQQMRLQRQGSVPPQATQHLPGSPRSAYGGHGPGPDATGYGMMFGNAAAMQQHTAGSPGDFFNRGHTGLNGGIIGGGNNIGGGGGGGGGLSNGGGQGLNHSELVRQELRAIVSGRAHRPPSHGPASMGLSPLGALSLGSGSGEGGSSGGGGAGGSGGGGGLNCSVVGSSNGGTITNAASSMLSGLGGPGRGGGGGGRSLSVDAGASGMLGYGGSGGNSSSADHDSSMLFNFQLNQKDSSANECSIMSDATNGSTHPADDKDDDGDDAHAHDDRSSVSGCKRAKSYRYDAKFPSTAEESLVPCPVLVVNFSEEIRVGDPRNSSLLLQKLLSD
uniref:Uncharacterized protein n=1 Tax=Anopheles atroparvus TaxID=41427 RepID=A0A182IZ83_ANOAO